ncbi:MAG: hypothetical protein P8163_06440 [Candidatus Thiodiazotropha sp.]
MPQASITTTEPKTNWEEGITLNDFKKPKADLLSVSLMSKSHPYPIITGRVFNTEQMPPWGLPANQTHPRRYGVID